MPSLAVHCPFREKYVGDSADAERYLRSSHQYTTGKRGTKRRVTAGDAPQSARAAQLKYVSLHVENRSRVHSRSTPQGWLLHEELPFRPS